MLDLKECSDALCHNNYIRHIRIFFKKSKYLFAVQTVWMWVLIGGLQGGADYNNYVAMFNMFGQSKPTVIGLESLYTLSCYFSTQLGINFEIYSLITTGVSLLLIISTIIKFTNRPCFVMSLFYFFPMADCAIQRRNFIASAIVIFGIRFLINSGIGNKFKFVLCVVIASGFHSLALIYLLFLVSDYISIATVKKFIIPFDIICFLLTPFIPKIASLIVNEQKMYSYFYDLSNRLSLAKVVAFILWQIINTVIILYFSRLKNIASIETHDLKYDKFDGVCVNINILLTMLLPFFYYNSTFFRIYRNIIILNYILVANRQMTTVAKKRNSSVLFTSIVFTASPILSCLLFYVLLGDMGAEYLLIPIFENNFIFDSISNMF